MPIDNEKTRRDREARLSGSRLDLNFCVPRGTSRSSRRIDSLGNTLTPISPPGNNNLSPGADEHDGQLLLQQRGKLLTSLTPSGECGGRGWETMWASGGRNGG